MSQQLDEARRQLAILDLKPGVSWQQLRDRYRFLAKVWHPDRFGSDQRARSRAEKQFTAVNAAYQWLLKHRRLIESLADSSQAEESDPARVERRPGTYALELLQREGTWMRTSQLAESPECPPHGEIWFMMGESDMTAIWHRLDGSQWFTSRLKLD